MALSSFRARAIRSNGLQRRCHTMCLVRAQTGTSNTSVNFKIHRHVEYGQSLLLVGNAPELGAWDPKNALALNWGEGDNWTASCAVPVGSAVEYKYIVKRGDGFDWCPGQNKAVQLPSAASVEVTDSWDNPHSTVVTLAPLDVAMEAPLGVADSAPSPVPATVADVAEVPAVAEVLVDAEANGAPIDVPGVVTESSAAAPEAVTAVSTVENLHVPELENGSPALAGLAAQHQQPPGLLANNIVQGVPLGAVAVGQDPITQYEEADKYQVVEVGEKAAASEPRLSATATAKSLDKMTMAELRTEVKRRGMSPLGNRRELLTRLQNAGVM